MHELHAGSRQLDLNRYTHALQALVNLASFDASQPCSVMY